MYFWKKSVHRGSAVHASCPVAIAARILKLSSLIGNIPLVAFREII